VTATTNPTTALPHVTVAGRAESLRTDFGATADGAPRAPGEGFVTAKGRGDILGEGNVVPRLERSVGVH
jgi:hypothetical protein